MVPDGGYDITDHYGVHPRFGSMGDFARLLNGPTERGIRVMLDLWSTTPATSTPGSSRPGPTAPRPNTTSVEEVRAEFGRVLAASKLWNGQTAVLQVVDTTERTMVLRALVSADSAPSAWDLRCEVRERLLSCLQAEHPRALPRVRASWRHRPGRHDRGDRPVRPTVVRTYVRLLYRACKPGKRTTPP